MSTWPTGQSQNDSISSSVATSMPQEIPAINKPTPDTANAQGVYQADEILIDGQGQDGQNYIDITSDTPITPEPQNSSTHNNNGGAYAEASITIDHNNNTNTFAQTYAPGEPGFEVIDGN